MSQVDILEEEATEKPFNARLMWRLICYLKPYRKWVSCALVLILMTSFGSGAGSDSFVLEPTERLKNRRAKAPTIRSMLDGPRRYLTYGEYAKLREKIMLNS